MPKGVQEPGSRGGGECEGKEGEKLRKWSLVYYFYMRIEGCEKERWLEVLISIRGDGRGHQAERWFPLVALIATQPSRYGSRSPNNHVCRACTAVSSSGEENRGSETPAGRKVKCGRGAETSE